MEEQKNNPYAPPKVDEFVPYEMSPRLRRVLFWIMVTSIITLTLI
jgi:hypothetical protein